jgi:hypothetical protein
LDEEAMVIIFVFVKVAGRVNLLLGDWENVIVLFPAAPGDLGWGLGWSKREI